MASKAFLKQEVEILLTTAMNIKACQLTALQTSCIETIEKCAWQLRATTMPNNSVAKKILRKLTKATAVKLGQKVTLKAIPGSKQERGTYMGKSGRECHMVRVDKKHLRGPHDDGLREVSTDQIKELDK